MNNILKDEKSLKNQKNESFIEKYYEEIGIMVEFALGCFVSLVAIGLLYVILHGLNYMGVVSTVTAAIWMVGCGVVMAICGLAFFVNIDMLNWDCFTDPYPMFWFAMTLVPGIFFVQVMIFA